VVQAKTAFRPTVSGSLDATVSETHLADPISNTSIVNGQLVTTRRDTDKRSGSGAGIALPSRSTPAAARPRT
jgi:outer membrane protein